MADEKGKPTDLPDNIIIAEEKAKRMLQLRERFHTLYSKWSNTHERGAGDDRMLAGEQWPVNIKSRRELAGRITLTYNLLSSFKRQIVNKLRQEAPQTKVIPVGTSKGRSPQIQNLQGTEDYEIAEVYNGIYRHIEQVSQADQAYDTASDHGAGHGFGYFYLINEYSREDPFEQELRIHRVKNSYSVLCGEAERADYADMPDAFIYSQLDTEVFKRKYPGHRASGGGGGLAYSYGASSKNWYSADYVQVAQYFFIEYEQDEILLMSNGTIVKHSAVKDVLDEMHEDQGITIQDRRKVKLPVCKWLKMTADEILEGPITLPFNAVPIFPVFGEEIIVDGEERYIGSIHDAIDAQISYNINRSSAAESAEMSIKAPAMVTKEQIKGHKDLWDRANDDNLPYLVYNETERGTQPSRLTNQGPDVASIQNAQTDKQDIQSIIGLYDDSLGKESNAESGIAIQRRVAQGSTSTFHITDNLTRAKMACLRQAIHAIPILMSANKVVRIRTPDDKEDFVEINKTVYDEETGTETLVHDLGYGMYDAYIDTGPSYLTQAQEASDLALELMKVLPPEMGANIAHVMVKHIPVSGADEVYEILRKMLPDELKSEGEREADLPKGVTFDGEGKPVNEDGTPYQPEPTPEQIQMKRQNDLLEKQIEAQMAEVAATKDMSDAKKAEAQAKLAKAQADLAAVQGELQQAQPQQQDNSEMIGKLQQIIEKAFEAHANDKNAHADEIATAAVESIKKVRKFYGDKPNVNNAA